MGLPIQKAPKHKCKLSDGTEVTYRPFLVKEQKYLLLAKEGKDSIEILEAVRQVVNQVTEGKVDSHKLPMYDLEYLFLQIRIKSVGETTKMTLYCRERDCEGTGKLEVNLGDVKIKYPEGDIIDPNVKLTDTLGVTLKFPTSEQMAKIEVIEDEGDQLVEMLKYGIQSIWDGDTIYDTDDVPDSELVQFVESLTLDQVDKLNEFFENIPTLQHDVEYKCDSCGTINSSTMTGLQSFF